ncbi:hypothetical protein BD311DRAFT_771033, partial [Dichomitus squalens]
TPAQHFAFVGQMLPRQLLRPPQREYGVYSSSSKSPRPIICVTGRSHTSVARYPGGLHTSL